MRRVLAFTAWIMLVAAASAVTGRAHADTDDLTLRIQLRDPITGGFPNQVHVRVDGGPSLCDAEGTTGNKGTIVFTFECEYLCTVPRTWSIYVAGAYRGSINATGCPNTYYKLINYPPLPAEIQ